jgi:DNA-binding LacI/PurR family transcriptional regulator
MGERPLQREFDPDMPYLTYADTGPWQIRSNFEEATRLGVGALAAQGCSQIGFWHSVDGDNEDDLYGKPLMPVLDTLCRERGLTLYPDLVQMGRIFLTSYAGPADLSLQERGYLTARTVFTRPGPRPDGLFLGDDMFAEGVLTAFHELGTRPGADIRIVSICNAGSPMLFGYEDMLTLVEYDPAELAVLFFDVLDVLMARGVPDPAMLLRKPRLIPPGERSRRNEILGRCGL